MMEEVGLSGQLNEDVSDPYDSLDEHNVRNIERWAPIGATASPPVESSVLPSDEMERLKRLEDDQEQLNSSLLALTTHFAQVQFRLNQIVNAPVDAKEDLLKELETFAFKGCPDLREVQSIRTQDSFDGDHMSSREHEELISKQRHKQKQLITQLKSQLVDLESFAYESGESEDLPHTVVIEKQSVIIEQLRNRLHIDLDHYDQRSAEDLKTIIDKAIGQIVNPAKLKENLLYQLQCQIADLERFINFLQMEGSGPGQGSANNPQCSCKCNCPLHDSKHSKSDRERRTLGLDESMDDLVPGCCLEPRDGQYNREQAQRSMQLMKRALVVVQMYMVSHFSCVSQFSNEAKMKAKTGATIYQDTLSRLKKAVDNVIAEADTDDFPSDSDYTSDSSDSPTGHVNANLLRAVRRQLAPSLRDLLQHGLVSIPESTALALPLGCFSSLASSKGPAVSSQMHAWELFVKYYELKHGNAYNQTPARKLSESFKLEIVGGQAITSKQTLLSAVHSIIMSHDPLKRSNDTMWKALICMGLNEGKLSAWCKLVCRTQSLVEKYYTGWSCVAKTGFTEAFLELDRVCSHTFNLPADIAVKPFYNIKDAF